MYIKDISYSLPTHPVKRYTTRDLSKIKYLVVHHSATSSGSPTAYANFHINEYDWAGIGYHFVIQPDGTVYKTNELETVSYHTAGKNTQAVGICMTGNFDNTLPTAMQYKALIELLTELSQQFPGASIKGHRNFSTKSCPGDNVDISKIRFDVDAMLNVYSGTPDYTNDGSPTHIEPIDKKKALKRTILVVAIATSVLMILFWLLKEIM